VALGGDKLNSKDTKIKRRAIILIAVFIGIFVIGITCLLFYFGLGLKEICGATSC